MTARSASSRPAGPKASTSSSNASGASPSAAATSVSGAPGGSVRTRACILFHSIWYAVTIGTRSSMSLALAMTTPSVSCPSHRIGRRRPRAFTTVHSRNMYPAASKSSCDCPRTIRFTLGMCRGSRPAA